MKINLAFEARFNSDGHGLTYFEDPRLEGSFYATSEAKAKNVLKAQLQKQVELALDNLANGRKRIIASKDGPCFIVEYSGGWVYHIAGPERTFAGSTLCADWKRAEDCIEAARKYAESTFGGVAWESSF